MTSLADKFSTRKLKGADKSPILLTRRRIFIIPTRHGFLFGIVLFSMLLGAINYNNSLAFALTFLLFSMVIVSMLHTHRNITGLRIESDPGKPVFAHDQARFVLKLYNQHNFRRLAICIQAQGQGIQNFDIEPNGKTLAHISLPAVTRGYITPGRIKIFTEYPLGLLYAWSWIQPETRCLVYPHPEENAPPPVFQQEGDGEHVKSSDGDDDFSGLRPYKPGDSVRRIAWKQSSWRDDLFTKEFSGGGTGKSLWLEWEHTGSSSMEQRLSRLCRWVLDCETTGVLYGLRLPEKTIAPSSGEMHQHECLKALALYGREDIA